MLGASLACLIKMALSTKNPFQKLAMKVAFYIAFFFVSLLLFIYLFFPYNRWKKDIEVILSQYSGKTVTIEDIDGWRIVGIKMKGITLSSEAAAEAQDREASKEEDGEEDEEEDEGKAKGKAAGEEKPKSDPDGDAGIRFDSIAVRPAILSLLFGKVGVIYSADIFDGDIDGRFKAGKITAIKVGLDDIDIENIDFLGNLLGLPFLGELRGDMDIEFPGQKINELSGDMKLVIKDLQIGAKGSKLDLAKAGGGIMKGAIKFDPVEVGDLVLELKGEDGTLKIEKLHASSKHLELDGAGEIKIKKPFSLSTLNIYVKFKFKDAYISKSPMTKSVFSTLDRLNKFRQAKRTDGFWGFAIRGSLAGKIKPIPARIGPGGM